MSPGPHTDQRTPSDTIWAMVRPNRRAHAIVHDPGDDVVASTGLAVLTPRAIPASFLFEHSSRQEFADFLAGRAGGAAYPAAKPSDFEDAAILVPPVPLMEAFDELAGPALRLASRLIDQNTALVRTRDLLLPRLVTGRLDISDIDLGSLLSQETAE